MAKKSYFNEFENNNKMKWFILRYSNIQGMNKYSIVNIKEIEYVITYKYIGYGILRIYILTK
jgi:hypothetical protein